jgi:hypothetical protein
MSSSTREIVASCPVYGTLYLTEAFAIIESLGEIIVCISLRRAGRLYWWLRFGVKFLLMIGLGEVENGKGIWGRVLEMQQKDLEIQ